MSHQIQPILKIGHVGIIGDEIVVQTLESEGDVTIIEMKTLGMMRQFNPLR
jgi:hypothetical protein